MKELYKRFGIEVDEAAALLMFRNKARSLARMNFTYDESYDLAESMVYRLGLPPQRIKLEELFETDVPWNQFLLRLQVLLEMLFVRADKRDYQLIAALIHSALEESPVDLGIRTKTTSDECAQIVPGGAPTLDKALLDDVLGVLELDPKKKAILTAFKKGLQEFIESGGKSEKLKNVVRDMQLAGDELAKFLLKDKNAGFAHLIKEKNWQTLGLNVYEMRMFAQMNEYIDKCAKHKADHEFEKHEAEFVMYTTGMLIRLTLLKQE